MEVGEVCVCVWGAHWGTSVIATTINNENNR